MVIGGGFDDDDDDDDDMIFELGRKLLRCACVAATRRGAAVVRWRFCELGRKLLRCACVAATRRGAAVVVVECGKPARKI